MSGTSGVPPPTMMRPLSTTLARYAGKGGPGSAISTTLPKCIAGILGTPPGSKIHWSITGHGCRVSSTESKPCRSVRVQTDCAVTIPRRIARRMGIQKGHQVDWLVAAHPGGIWEVYAAPGGERQRLGVPSRTGPVKISRLLLATTRLYKYEAKKGVFYRRTSVPRPCLRVLMAGGQTWVRWEESDGYFNIIPCGREHPRARKVSGTVPDSGPGPASSVRLEKEVARCLFRGPKPAINWYIAADGRGRWEVHVGPA